MVLHFHHFALLGNGNQADRVHHFLCYVYSLANVDPIDVAKNITGLNPETTLGRFFIHQEHCHSNFHSS